VRRKNQFADLKRLLALPTRDMKRQYEDYIYEDLSRVLPMLFRLARSLSGKQEKSNVILLLKNLIEQSDEFSKDIPEWMVPELDTFIRNPLFTDRQKAHVLSIFDPDELFKRVITFEKFVQRFVEIRESFEDYIVREIREKRSRLFDIYVTIMERTSPDVIRSMIIDLKGSSYPEAAELLELFTYAPNPDISSLAFHAIKGSDTPYTPVALRSIGRLNPLYLKKARTSSMNTKRTFPETPPVSARDKDIMDIGISLPDGNGVLSAVAGARLSRNEYLFIHILYMHGFGFKDISLYTSLSYDGYTEVRDSFLNDSRLLASQEDFFVQLLEHLIHESMQAGSPIPEEIIALKNLMGWFDLDPRSIPLTKKRPSRQGYALSDLEHFPITEWWLKSNRIFHLLEEFRDTDVSRIPEEVLSNVAAAYMEHARSMIMPLCALCSEILLHSASEQTQDLLADTFLAVMSEIESFPDDPFASLFIFYQSINTVHHSIDCLRKGITSVELS